MSRPAAPAAPLEAGARRGAVTPVASGADPTIHRAADVRSEVELRALVAAGRSDPRYQRLFEDLLREDQPLYRGRGTAAVSRMRGWLLLALGEDALPVSALPFVLEELESPHEAYLAAVAARVLRRTPPRPELVPALLTALHVLRFHDDAVHLGRYGGSAPAAGEAAGSDAGDRDGTGRGSGAREEPTTATAEILAALAGLGAAARPALDRLRSLRAEPQLAPDLAIRLDRTIAAIESERAERDREDRAPSSCCCGTAAGTGSEDATEAPGVVPPSFAEVADVALQDHSGTTLRFGDFFCGRPSIVVFFYTRCDNPSKCARTVSRLGRVQRLLRARGLAEAVRTAAITYDPAYDRPERLARYAATWGAELDADHRLLRTVEVLDPLRAYFDLGVGFGPAMVNRHRVEAFVLDRDGGIAASVTRRQWHETELVAAAEALLA